MQLSRAEILLVLLACASVSLSASQGDCFTDPTSSSCVDFKIDTAAIEQDLDTFCRIDQAEPAYGWPSACTLWHECHAGQAAPEACNHLSILRTACQEQPVGIPLCENYSSLCAPGSKVAACKTFQPLPSVPTADSLYQTAQQLCDTMPDMPGCDQCAPQTPPGMVTAQALQVRCPNPLESVSAMCISMWMTGCEPWDTFCKDNGNNTAFPWLCDENYDPSASPMRPDAKQSNGSIPAPVPENENPGNAPGPKQGTGAAATVGEGPDRCVTVPTDAECAGYRLPEAAAEEDIKAVCDAMPTMVGCTLVAACKAGTASGPYCAPFSLLGDLCLDMPSMKGCQTFNSMCGTQGTVISQCTSEGPIPSVLRTEETMDAIIEMCSTHSMVGCDECTSRWSNCPDPLATISKLCLGMPGMPQCSRFFAMCSDASGTFTQVCGQGSDSNGALPPMKMYMHASMREIILLKEWVPESDGAYIGACIGVIVAAVLVQALKGLRVRIETVWAAQRRVVCCAPSCPENAPSPGGSKTPEPVEALTQQQGRCCGGSVQGNGAASSAPAAAAPAVMVMQTAALEVPQRTKRGCTEKLNPENSLMMRNAVRAGFTTLVVFLDYMLMLIVMTFNIGLIVSAVLGFALGALLFGHLGEGGAAGGGAVAVGEVAPDSENDLEVHSIDPQTCCNSQHV